MNFNVRHNGEIISAPLSTTPTSPAFTIRWQGQTLYNELVSPTASNALPVRIKHNGIIYALSDTSDDVGIPLIKSDGTCYSFINGNIENVGTVPTSYDSFTYNTEGAVLVYNTANLPNDEVVILASNIDESGNVFALVVRWEAIGEPDDPDVYSPSVCYFDIYKNGSVIRTVNADAIVEAYISNLHYSFSVSYQFDTEISHWDTPSGFIENENNWYFSFFWESSDSWWEQTYEPGEELPTPNKKAVLKARIYVNQTGTYVLMETATEAPGSSIEGDDFPFVVPFWYETHTSGMSVVEIPLHGGYYLTQSFLEDEDGEIPSPPWVLYYPSAGAYSTIQTFFSPNRNPIYSSIGLAGGNVFMFEAQFLKEDDGRYLVLAKDNIIFDDENWLPAGLYRYDGENFTPIIQGRFKNEKLLRMKNIKNWHERIQAITLERDST